MKTILDAVIVGGGLAGLSAAKVLKERKMDFKLIEADSRVGGKVLSVNNSDNSGFYELGPQFVNKDMTEMIKLIKQAGMDLNETVLLEDAAAIDDLKRKQIDLESLKMEELFNLKELKKEDKSMFELYDPMVQDPVLKKVITGTLAELFNIHPRELSGKAAVKRAHESLSFSQTDLAYQASGKLTNVISSLEDHVKSRVIKNDPIIEVLEYEGGYKIRSANNNEYFAKAVIIAVPPTVANQLSFSKEIESHFKEALESFIEGSIIKITWQFDKPFWHHTHVQGQEVKVKEILYTKYEGIGVVDSSRGKDYRLTMFIGADLAKQLAKEDESHRLAFALDRLKDVFGEQAADYKDVAEKSWVGAAGGYGASIRLNGLTDAGDILKTPYRNLVFASSEISSFASYMEGAVRAGKHAASSINRSGIYSWLHRVF